MIISEKQILQLIHIARTFQKHLLHADMTQEENTMYLIIENMIVDIIHQQSEELKEFKY